MNQNYLFQEKDFEFEGENVFNPDAKIVDGTFLDDEDYLHDDGSTPESDDQVTGSGTGPTDIHTIFPTRLPTGSLDGPGSFETGRILIFRLFMNAIWMLYSVVEVIGYYGHDAMSISSMLMHNYFQWVPPTVLIICESSRNHSSVLMILIMKMMTITVRQKKVEYVILDNYVHRFVLLLSSCAIVFKP